MSFRVAEINTNKQTSWWSLELWSQQTFKKLLFQYGDHKNNNLDKVSRGFIRKAEPLSNMGEEKSTHSVYTSGTEIEGSSCCKRSNLNRNSWPNIWKIKSMPKFIIIHLEERMWLFLFNLVASHPVVLYPCHSKLQIEGHGGASVKLQPG